jgi:hypothetical protein
MIELVDPRGRIDPHGARLAGRRRRGEIRRIGFLSNEEEFMHGPLHFPRYTRILERVLPERIGATPSFHREVKPVLSRPATPEQLAAFTGYDAVVNGLAK